MSGDRSINQGLLVVSLILFCLAFAVIVGHYIPGNIIFPGIGASILIAGVAALASSYDEQRNYVKILFSLITIALGVFFLLEHYYLSQVVAHNVMGIMINLAFVGLVVDAFIGAILFLED